MCPVFKFLAEILALGTASPEGVVTVPDNDAPAWLQAELEASIHRAKAKAIREHRGKLAFMKLLLKVLAAVRRPDARVESYRCLTATGGCKG